MPYPPQYTGSKYSAPTNCVSCSVQIPDEAAYNNHFSKDGYCTARGYTSIEGYINNNWPSWVAQQQQATPVAKGLHWKGKVWPIGTCKLCKREKQALSKEMKGTVGSTMVSLVQAGMCRLCVQTIADVFDDAASTMTKAHYGGERK